MAFIFYQIDTVIGEQVGNLAGRFLTGAVGILIVVIIVVFIGFVFWWIRWRRSFSIFVEIQSARSGGVVPKEIEGEIKGDEYVKYVTRALQSGNYRLIYDVAALKYDKKDKSWYYRIRDEKVSLTVPPFNVLQPSNKGNVLKIWQKSPIEYYYLLPGKINEEFMVRSDGKTYPIAEIEQYQLEGDDPAWIMDRQRRNRNWFAPDSWLMKLLQYAPAIIISIITLFLIWIVLGKLPPLIDQLRHLAEAIAQAQQGQFVQG